MISKHKLNKAEEKMVEIAIKGLERGELVWTKSWAGGGVSGAINHTTKKRYRGINTYLTWIAYEEGYKHNQWLTLNQILTKMKLTKKRLGKAFWFEDKDGKKYKWYDIFVKRDDGKKQPSYPVEFSQPKYRYKVDGKLYTKEQLENLIQDGATLEEFKMMWVTRCYNVYNIEQTKLPKPKTKKLKKNRVTNAEKILDDVIAKYKGRPDMNIKYSDRAFYSPSQHSITLPLPQQFKEKYNGTGQLHFVDTAFHELIHSTGHESLLDRFENTFFDRDHSYAKEELIAQSGACMMMEYFNLNNTKTTELTQAYLKGWLSKLKNEPTILTQAMRQSTRAVKTILNGDGFYEDYNESRE